MSPDSSSTRTELTAKAWAVFSVVALAAVTIALAASPAQGHHIAGASYTGTYSLGGTVTFRVSGDGTTVDGYQTGSAPTPIVGQPGGPFTCTINGGSQNFLSAAIIDHEFEFPPFGAFFKGSFASRQTATGTLQFVVGGGACRSQVLTWSAGTTESPTGSEECKSANAAVATAKARVARAKKAVARAKKAIKRAATTRAKAKARKKLKAAKRKLKNARNQLTNAGNQAAPVCG
jgi:hypothetical protein